jgi:hypothetical protein
MDSEGLTSSVLNCSMDRNKSSGVVVFLVLRNASVHLWPLSRFISYSIFIK